MSIRDRDKDDDGVPNQYRVNESYHPIKYAYISMTNAANSPHQNKSLVVKVQINRILS